MVQLDFIPRYCGTPHKLAAWKSEREGADEDGLQKKRTFQIPIAHTTGESKNSSVSIIKQGATGKVRSQVPTLPT